MADTPTELELTRGALEREISRAIAVDAELTRQRQRAEEAEAERDALKTKVADYENAINWDTSCTEHGRLLDAVRTAEEQRDALKAAIADVRRLCDLTIATSCRAQAIDQATDTLAALDRALAVPESTEGSDE